MMNAERRTGTLSQDAGFNRRFASYAFNLALQKRQPKNYCHRFRRYIRCSSQTQKLIGLAPFANILHSSSSHHTETFEWSAHFGTAFRKSIIRLYLLVSRSAARLSTVLA